MRSIAYLAASSIVLVSSLATAATYNEAVNGDLSGDASAPTVLHLDPGANPVSATSVAGDIEYFTFTVPIGFKLTAINLTSYANGNLSFIAVQRGTVFTELPSNPNVANLLGWTHFGSGNGTIGTDILDNMGAGSGAQGFVPPLGPGNYVFWAQEASGTPVSYTLSFQLTGFPAPATTPVTTLALAAGLGLFGVFLVRARSRSARSANS
jgi:hypothetical protein